MRSRNVPRSEVNSCLSLWALSCAAEVLAFDLYMPGEKPGHPVLYRQRTHPFTQSDLARLLERGVRTLYIPSGDAEYYREHLRDNVLTNKNIPPVRRYKSLRKATGALFSEALTGGDSNAAVTVTKDISREMVRTVCESKLIINELLKSMSHDYSSFTHAMNVSTYCLLLAQQWGISDEKELLEIGQAALLHDIGMQQVPRQIIDKPGKLTARERQVVQCHPSFGFRELCNRDDLSIGQLMMVFSHHERCDGLGYPVGLVRRKFTPTPDCTIADSYAALLSQRPHRTAARKPNVIEYLDRQAGRAFDEGMTRCWLTTMANKK